jgi:hypothetical protein
MTAIDDKVHFLKNEFIPLLKSIPFDKPPMWGKMNLHQMVEHFSHALRVASGRVTVTQMVTPNEHLEKMRSFLMSDKPFRENTPNPLMPEVPEHVHDKTIDDSIAELNTEIDYFFSVFESNQQQQTRNPFFGDLDYKMNVQMLYKHAVHHLKQFGVMA